MELFTIDTILPIASEALFITQAVYYLGLYNKLYTHSRETAYATDINTQNPPLSVIIVAKDATHELQENLPFILEQDYPEFEVIVIYDRPADDCDNTLKLLEDKYPNLYHTFIPDSARYISHKKLGITMGIKASRHEWLVFTEPDCRPQSNQWLKQMARNFTPATEIVLGYSNYEKVPGWFNKKITFDTLLNSMRYLGMAVSGHPYMDKGLLDRLNHVVKSEFGHVTYTEAIEILEKNNDKFDYKVFWGCDLQTEHERYLTEQIFKKPVFVTDYPKEIKAFYMKQNEDGKTVAAMDCLVPGIGEIIGGSQREDDYEKLRTRMEELGLKAEEYQFYMDLRKYGSTRHSGYGLGFERCVMYLTGMGYIRDVIPFPRTVNNCDL